jgi:hypothetical protein
MDEFVIVELPDHLNDDEIKEYLITNVKDLYQAMDLEVDDFDDRALLDWVTITQIDLTSDSIHIEFDVEYSAYHGCKDQNYSDSDARAIAGERKGKKLIFDKYIAPPKRTTYDEF